MHAKDDYTARRKELERALLDAAAELLAYTGAAAVVVPVPGAGPERFVAVGEPEEIVEDLMLAGALR